ncbi:hypothetical protein [Paludisphaera mucosa]|uniref:Uncharacterized protein n=1 Tax=Paludisphaera mucosa TaxID=3030827 RepID=A0ABT6FJ50_9BACT|nr:hypothetical protein [Paludisphaera mucosa]MDG3007526.1 hypothetical protein [Paludisphaera mucosa]
MTESNGDVANGGAQTTIVCCIERGRLEPETLLMLETLRKWGGPLGRSRVLAVMPRRDRRLRPETLKALEGLEVEVHDASRYNKMRWFNWYGKVAAALLAEREATTPVVTWLDSDALIFGPLVELGLPHGDDFAARRETLPPCVRDDSGPTVEFWRRACRVVGLDWDEVPWLPADGPSPPQRMYFNAGINAFRRGLGFAETYADCTLRLLRGRIADDSGSFWNSEQMSVTFAMLLRKMKCRELPRAENHMVFDCHIEGPQAAPSIADARLVHYGRSRNPDHWARFMERFRRERPEHYDWLRERGPLLAESGGRDPVHLARKIYRRLYTDVYAKQCRRATADWKAGRADLS